MLSAKTCLSSILAVAAATPAFAQTPWNRKIENVAALPSPGGGYDLHIIWSASVEETSTPLDLSTQAVVFLNGSAVGVATTELGIDPGAGFCGGAPCIGGCGTGYIDGVTAAALLCIDCECRTPPLTSVVPGVPLQPEDYIEVLLMPSPGALPDPDTSDDLHAIQFHGDPIFWNRRLASVELQPTASDQFFDVFVEVEVEANFDGRANAGGMLVLEINGERAGESPVPALDLDLVWTQCANVACNDTVACVMDAQGPYYGTCQENEAQTCACLYHPEPDIPFPGVLIAPDDVVVVKLIPLPGALPELPGFPEDEEEVPLPNPCPADVNADGMVDVQDLVELFLNWGCTDPPGPCPGDVNEDGIVNVQDVVDMLLAWGNCFPV